MRDALIAATGAGRHHRLDRGDGIQQDMAGELLLRRGPTDRGASRDDLCGCGATQMLTQKCGKRHLRVRSLCRGAQGSCGSRYLVGRDGCGGVARLAYVVGHT